MKVILFQNRTVLLLKVANYPNYSGAPKLTLGKEYDVIDSFFLTMTYI
jgi:hypothetical protein